MNILLDSGVKNWGRLIFPNNTVCDQPGRGDDSKQIKMDFLWTGF
ncbi:MAG: hypothetical protein ACTHMM_10955 [Agriterribacter sp.]